MDKLLSLKAASERLGVSVWTLRRWVWARKVPSVKLGRRVFMREGDIEALVLAGLRHADERVCLPGAEPFEGCR